MISVANNLLAMNAQRQYGMIQTDKGKSSEKLASGYKINRAADDAAGLSISEKMRAQIRGLNQGSENCQDGVSLCQVADGALAEVNDMLNRLTELSVQAANGTLSESDRAAIQQEIKEIKSEINRIGDTTEFNTRPLFKGHDEVLLDKSGKPISIGSIPYEKFKLADVSLGLEPIKDGAPADYLNLSAIVKDPGSPVDGRRYNLIYGSGDSIGGTSQSGVILNYTKDGVTTKIQANLGDSFSVGNYHHDGNIWTRDFEYSNGDGVNLKITQKIEVNDSSTTKKTYNFSYNIDDSNSTVENLKVDFIFNIDTVYNTDQEEDYKLNGNTVTKGFITKKPSHSSSCPLDNTDPAVTISSNDVPYGISMIGNSDSQLSFTQNMSAPNADHIIVGSWTDSLNNNVSNAISLSTLLARDIERYGKKDYAMTLVFENAANTNNVYFEYGILPIKGDPNVDPDIVPSREVLKDHYSDWNLRIQAGPSVKDGLLLHMQEMNSTVLGLDKMDVMSEDSATKSIDIVGKAVEKISEFRSIIGAQTNRLEHSIAIDDNTEENTQAAESRIRDTDVAKEMINQSMFNILSQAGEAMLSQTNQNAQSILSLLQ